MPSAEVNALARTTSDIGTLVHENYVNKVLPWLDLICPMAAVFDELGDGGYTLIGEKLMLSADVIAAGMAMATDGHLPDNQTVNPIEFTTTPTRSYVRRSIDNYLQALAKQPGAYEDFMSRIMRQMWEAWERKVARDIHGSSAATVCKVVSRTSATIVVVEDGYGYDGADPGQWLDDGMWLASLDASNSFATLGAAKIAAGGISALDGSTNMRRTLTFATSIEGAGTIAVGDLLVFCTTTDTTANHFVTERNRAPLGLLDIMDPGAANSTYLTVTEATYPRVKPVRRASSSFDHVEIMEFVEEVATTGNAAVTPESHVLTMHPGLKTELAKQLLQFQQQFQLGGELRGGWKSVMIGDWSLVTDPYHIPDVVYLLCKEDMKVVNLDGEPAVWQGDGSEYQRILNYDGYEWFAKHYVQRFADRRNRSGVLTGIANPYKARFIPRP